MSEKCSNTIEVTKFQLVFSEPIIGIECHLSFGIDDQKITVHHPNSRSYFKCRGFEYKDLKIYMSEIMGEVETIFKESNY